MIRNDALRVWLRYLTTALLVVFIGYSLREVINQPRYHDYQPDIDAYAQLKPLVQNVEMVGFVTDAATQPGRIVRILIQYAIAPVLLNAKDAHCCGLTVGYFASSTPPENYEVIKVVNKNVFLLKEKDEAHEPG